MKKILLASLIIVGTTFGGASKLITKSSNSICTHKNLSNYQDDPESYHFQGGSDLTTNRDYNFTINATHIEALYNDLQQVPHAASYEGGCIYSFFTNNYGIEHHDHWGYGDQFWKDMHHWFDRDSFFSMLKQQNPYTYKGGFKLSVFLYELDHEHRLAAWQDLSFHFHENYNGILFHNGYYMDFIVPC